MTAPSQVVVGTIPITPTVDSNGSFSVNVKLQVPPARFAPSLSLSYHSTAGDLSLGPGWFNKVEASVQRVAATIAQDGFRGAVNYDSNDRFAINGQRIIRVGSTNEYRYELEQWSKITAIGKDAANPDSWTERFPDGSCRTFGSTTDSNVKACGGKSTRVWAVCTLTDAFTNYISYDYTTDTSDGSYYLSSIQYGGNSVLKLAHRCKITFEYETRPDFRNRYIGGYKVAHTKRMTTITFAVSGTVAYKYMLSYDSAPLTGKSRLIKILMSDEKGNYVEPLVFRWNDAQTKVYNKFKTLSSLSNTTSSGSVMLLDVAGSGKADLVVASKQSSNLYIDVFRATEQASFTTTSASGSGDTGLTYPNFLLPIESRGGGNTDLLHILDTVDDDTHTHTLTLLYWTPSGYEKQTSKSFQPEVSDGRYLTGDFEGSGMIGLVYVYTKLVSDSKVLYFVQFVRDGDHFTAKDAVQGPSGVSMDTLQIVLGDLNGNGADDVFMMHPFESDGSKLTKIYFLESSKGVLTYRSDDPFGNVGDSVDWTDSTTFHPYRVDEDGKTSLLSLSKSSDGNLQYQILRSSGPCLISATAVEETSFTYDGEISLTPTTSRDTADLVNITSTSDGPVVNLLRFFTDKLVGVASIQQPDSDSANDTVFHSADLRGIGRGDCIFTKHDSSDNLNVFQLPCFDDQPADYICSYTNGLGGTVDVTYAPLAESSVYSTSDTSSATAALNATARNSSSTFHLASSTSSSTPARNRALVIHSPSYVVKEFTSCSHPSLHPELVAKTTFKYQDAVLSFDGRGWLGFKSITKVIQPQNNTITTQYLQDFPLTGRSSSVLTSSASSGKQLLSKTYSWTSSKTKAGSQLVSMSSLDESHFEGGTLAQTATASHTYDAYGNILQTVISSVPSCRPNVTMMSKYLNDEKNWIIGAKLEQTVSAGESDSRCMKLKYLPGTLSVCERSRQIDASTWRTETMSFDQVGNLISSEGPGPAKQSMTYTPDYAFVSSQKTYISSTKSLLEKFTFNPVNGHPSSTTDANGHIIAHEYDLLGNLTSVSEGESADAMVVVEKQSSSSINDDRCVKTQKLCDQSTQSWMVEVRHLDGAHKTWRAEKTLPGSTSVSVFSDNVYDGAERLIRESGPYQSGTNPRWKEYTFDDLSRHDTIKTPCAVEGQDPVVVKFDYSYSAGETAVRESRNGGGNTQVTRSYSLQSFPVTDLGTSDILLKDQVIATVDEVGHRVDRNFNAFGKPTSIKDGAGVEVVLSWDGLGRKIEHYIRQSSGSTTRTISHYKIKYDESSFTTTISNVQSGKDVVFKRDWMHRMTSKTTPEETTTLVYDSGGSNAKHRLASVTSSLGLVQNFDYDTRGNITCSELAIDGNTYSTNYTWNAAREILSVKNPDGSILNKTYHLNSISPKRISLDGVDGKTKLGSNFTDYNEHFQPTSNAMDHGLSSQVRFSPAGVPTISDLAKGTSSVLKQTWSYGGIGRIDKYNRKAPNYADLSQDFEYTGSGQLSGRNQTSGTTKTTHDLSYDASGNIIKNADYTFSTDGWQLAHSTDRDGNVFRKFTYSTSGSLTEIHDSSGSVVRQMSYDAEERLIGVGKTVFVYDFCGRVVKVVRSDGSTTLYPTIWYEIDKFSSGATTTQSYLEHRGRRGVFTVEKDANGTVTKPSVKYFHADHLGSTIAVTDGDGSVLTTYEYGPLGNITVNGDDTARYKFSGKEAFEGMYYFGARFYDPEIGRFVTLDNLPLNLGKIHSPSQLNYYSFSRNDPINFIDWNGNESKEHAAQTWHIAIDVVLLSVGIALLLAPEFEVPYLSALIADGTAGRIAVEVTADMAFGAGMAGVSYDAKNGHDPEKKTDLQWAKEMFFGAVLGAFVDYGAAKLLSKWGAQSAGEYFAANAAGKVRFRRIAAGKSAIEVAKGGARGYVSNQLDNWVEGKDLGWSQESMTAILLGAATFGLIGATKYQREFIKIKDQALKMRNTSTQFVNEGIEMKPLEDAEESVESVVVVRF